ncbi:hypothetical protein GW750_08130 [bacterium]|nr:hypothetical protein [bacterium]
MYIVPSAATSILTDSKVLLSKSAGCHTNSHMSQFFLLTTREDQNPASMYATYI